METAPPQTITGLELARKDSASVTSTGERIAREIEGVAVHRSRTQADIRGTLCEIYDERWGFTSEPVPFVYLVTVNPDEIKGWSVHLRQDDRMFFDTGTLRVTLYDGRTDSPSFGVVNVFHFGAHDRALLRIPAGVYHAVRNVGDGAAAFLNLPTEPYDHAEPDKYRLPADTDLLPVSP